MGGGSSLETRPTASTKRNPGCRKKVSPVIFFSLGVSGGCGEQDSGHRCPPRPSPTHRTCPVTASDSGWDGGSLLSPPTTWAWLSSPCCAVSGLWASLPPAWLTSVCGRGWEGTDMSKTYSEQKENHKSHAGQGWGKDGGDLLETFRGKMKCHPEQR